MLGSRYWVAHGAIEAIKEGAEEIAPSEERKRFDTGHIRITTGKMGTELKWHVQTPSFASLFVTIGWLARAQAPVVLRFFLSGWFEEFYQTTGEAAQRIEMIIARSDRHFPVKTFVEQVDPSQAALTPFLRQCMTSARLPEDFIVDCAWDKATDRFSVERVGANSLMGRIYGNVNNSFAHQTTGSFSETVSQGYREVMDSGRPRTDHVLAALRLSNNQVHWVPYHRLILPRQLAENRQGVTVVAEAAKIAFKVL